MNLVSFFWWTWNHIAFLPLALCTTIRIMRPSKQMSESRLDWTVRLLLGPSLIYYTLDTIAIINQIHKFGWCNFAYLLHHVISLTAYREIMTLPTYPWFLIIPFTNHCLMLMFPNESWLNYVYFALMIHCLFRLRQDPWRKIEKYYWLFKIMLLVIMGPCILLWMNKCKNNMNNVE
jgi:hypothetical protein